MARTEGEPRIAEEAEIGPDEQLVSDRDHQIRKSLAPQLRVAVDIDPASLAEPFVDVVEVGGRIHLAIVEAATHAIAFRIGRTQLLFRELGRLVDDHVKGRPVEFPVPVQSEELVGPELFPEGKLDVPYVRLVRAHSFSFPGVGGPGFESWSLLGQTKKRRNSDSINRTFPIQSFSRVDSFICLTARTGEC